VTQTPEKLWEAQSRRKTPHLAAPGEESDGPLLDPDVMKQVTAVTQRQVENCVTRSFRRWVGRTPLEAVANRDGRELVEALLLGWERANEGMPAGPGTLRPDLNAVRTLLNLPSSVD